MSTCFLAPVVAADDGVSDSSFFVGPGVPALGSHGAWMHAPGSRFGVADDLNPRGDGFGTSGGHEFGFGREPESRPNTLFGGYRFNQYFSVELGLAEFDADARHREGHRWGTPLPHELQDSADDAELTAMSAAVTGALPLGKQVNVFGKAGLFRWELDAQRSATRIDDPDDSGYQLQLGIGSDFQFTERLSVGAQWEFMSDLDRDADRTGEHIFSGRFRFEF